MNLSGEMDLFDPKIVSEMKRAQEELSQEKKEIKEEISGDEDKSHLNKFFKVIGPGDLKMNLTHYGDLCGEVERQVMDLKKFRRLLDQNEVSLMETISDLIGTWDIGDEFILLCQVYFSSVACTIDPTFMSDDLTELWEFYAECGDLLEQGSKEEMVSFVSSDIGTLANSSHILLAFIS
jgi:hypothetical protein